jgi:hypothetical protein
VLDITARQMMVHRQHVADAPLAIPNSAIDPGELLPSARIPNRGQND